MTDPLRPFVARYGLAVLDGGLATELTRRGVRIDGALWSAAALVDAPEIVAAVHRDYLEAGADVITTATYQATMPALPERVLVDAVTLAARERDLFWSRAQGSGERERPLVAASIGSYGAFLADGSEYRGGYRLGAARLADWHRPRVRALERAGADLLAFETFPQAEEVAAIVALLDEREGPPAWISIQARDGTALADGTTVEEAIAGVERSARVLAVGVNCVAPELVAPVLARLATVTSKPLVAYPNRGERWDAVERRWTGPASPVPLDRLAREWRDAGARLIGGCCRTTPDDVRAIRRGTRPI
jgi:homocysteine S-methyltransferase